MPAPADNFSVNGILESARALAFALSDEDCSKPSRTGRVPSGNGATAAGFSAALLVRAGEPAVVEVPVISSLRELPSLV